MKEFKISGLSHSASAPSNVGGHGGGRNQVGPGGANPGGGRNQGNNQGD